MEEIDIKEDINRIKYILEFGKKTGINYALETDDEKSLNNILNELERLQKENEEWQKAYQLEKDEQFNILTKKCSHCGNDKPLYCENCYQELITKNAELQLENEDSVVAIEFAVLRKQINDSIPKQVIRDRITDLEEYIYKGKNAPQDFLQYRVKAKIQVLEELLEEVNK